MAIGTGIVVWGSWHGGTSAVASVLHHLGVYMADKLVASRPGENWIHYEDQDYSRMMGGVVGQRASPSRAKGDGYDNLRTLIHRRERNHRLWGLKDVRSIFAPLYPMMYAGGQVKAISVWRGIPAVSASLSNKGLALEYKQAHQLARDKYSGDVLDINYDDLMRRPEYEVNRIVQFVGIGANVSQVTSDALDPNLYHHKAPATIPTFSPGLRWYCDKILANEPFSFLRYGEGEWRIAVIDLPTKSPAFGFWFCDDGRRVLQRTLTDVHEAENYHIAVWHQQFLQDLGRLHCVKHWISKNMPKDYRFHDGWLWRRTLTSGRLHLFTNAVRDSGLPVIVIGPKWHKHMPDFGWNVRTRIRTHDTKAFFQRKEIGSTILDFHSRHPNAIALLSCGSVSNVVIHDVFPHVGNDMFLVNCGAMWDPFCKHNSRIFHGRLSGKVRRMNLAGTR